MRMDIGLDTGPMFLQRPITVGPGETGGSLHDRLASEGATAVLEVLDALAEDSARSTPQPENGVTYAAKIDKGEATVDWSRSADEIERQVRAFNPWPVAQTRLDGEQLRIYRASVTDTVFGTISAEPGTIVDVRDDFILVACGRGYLSLHEIQRPGRRPVAARDLANTLELMGRRLG
jgi:methionyl-tRNA formyltransferase